MSTTGLILAGLIGTAVMTIFMQIGAKMGMMPPDFNMMIDGMGQKMNDMMGVPNQAAMLMHFIIGSLVLPLLYQFFWIEVLSLGLGVLGALIFFNIFGLIMIFMLPMLGAPEEWRGKMSIGIIMGHIVYALIVFYLEGPLSF